MLRRWIAFLRRIATSPPTLVMGVLRWQLVLDARISAALNRQTKLDAAVATALRLGAFQLLLLDRIPPHAAIHDSVELTKRAGHRFASGLVNAVLRKIAAASPCSPADNIAAHPAWLIARWKRLFTQSELDALCAYDQRPPPLTIRLASAEAREPQQNATLLPGAFLTRACSITRGDGRETIPDGARIQDEGSQLVAELAGEGRRILDCCAAPGGKTAILAERNPGAEIFACDISPVRVRQMQQNFAQLPETARIYCVQADATVMVTETQLSGLFDLILCDAPCSGTGTLARNPEIKLRLTPDDFARQQARQEAILDAAVRKLAPGGRVVYSTCSLEPEENEQVVEHTLAVHPELQVVSIGKRLAELERSGVLLPHAAELLRRYGVRSGFLRTVPGTLPCDGFFAAVLQRSQT